MLHREAEAETLRNLYFLTSDTVVSLKENFICTLYNVHCTMYMYNVHCTLYILQ